METITVQDYNIETASGGNEGVMIVSSVITIVLIVFLIVAMWKIFKKAGFAGWKSIIPFYNQYCLFRISGMSGWWIFLPIVATLCLTPSVVATGPNGTMTFQIGPMFIIGIFLAVAAGIIEIVQVVKLASAFKKGLGFKIASVFFPEITYLILGFGKAKYNKKYLHD